MKSPPPSTGASEPKARELFPLDNDIRIKASEPSGEGANEQGLLNIQDCSIFNGDRR